MSQRADTMRRLRSGLARARKSIDTVDMSAQLICVDGAWRGGVTPVSDYTPLPIGGVYSPLRGSNIDARKPATDLTATIGQWPLFESDAPLLMLKGGERSGKTEAAIIWIVAQMLVPGSKCAVLLPSHTKYPEYESKLLDICGSVGGRWIKRYLQQSKRFIFHNTSRLQFFACRTSTRDQTSYLSYEFHRMVFSEARELSHDDAQKHFQQCFSRVISLDGQLLVETSPEAGHFVEDLGRGVANIGNESVPVEVIRLNSRENPFSKPNRDDPDRMYRIAKSLYPPDVYERKVEGKDAPRKDVDYYCFDRTRHLVDKMPWPDRTGELRNSEFGWGCHVRASGKKGLARVKQADRDQYIVGLDPSVNAYHFVVVKLGLSSGDWTLGCEHRICYYVASVLQVLQPGLANALDKLMALPQMKGVSRSQVTIVPDPFGLGLVRDQHNRNVVKIVQAAGFAVRFYSARQARALMTRDKARDAVNAKFHSGQIAIHRSCHVLERNLLRFKSVDGTDTRRQSKDPDGQLPDALKIVVSMLSPFDSILQHVTQQEA